jgi:hypothetical protein
MRSTLAKEFINRKLHEYKEPVRKGKAKGVTVGLSSRKYTAALLMAIYALSTQEVEEVIGTKRSLISKWHTELKFLQQMEELRTEFGAEISGALTSGKNEVAFTDAQHYSAEIRKIIVAMCDDAVGNADGDFLLKAWCLLRVRC